MLLPSAYSRERSRKKSLEGICVLLVEDNELNADIAQTLTANVFKEDVKKCLDAGMNAHLAKPLDIEKVKETISSVV